MMCVIITIKAGSQLALAVSARLWFCQQKFFHAVRSHVGP